MARQNLENNVPFGEQREKINENFTEVYEGLVPDGGQEGQVLAKTSNNDYDVNWVSLQEEQKVFLIDDLNNVEAAYGLNKLKSGADKFIRLRREGDNFEQDFSFNLEGEFPLIEISNFLDSKKGFIVALYDQSGNGNNCSQSNPSLQPYLFLDNGLCRIRYEFDGESSIGKALNYDTTPIDARNTCVFTVVSPYLSTATPSSDGGAYTTRHLFASENNKVGLFVDRESILQNTLSVQNGTTEPSGLSLPISLHTVYINSSTNGYKLKVNDRDFQSSAAQSSTENKFTIGNNFQNSGSPFVGDILCYIHFNTSNTEEQLDDLESKASRLFSKNESDYNFVDVGDSIMMAGGTQNGSFVNTSEFTKNNKFYNFGVAGNRFPHLVAEANTVDSCLFVGKTNVLTIFCGTNDLEYGSNTPQSVYDDAVNYAIARSNAGWDIIIMVCMIKRFSTNDSLRVQYNNLLKGNTTNFTYVLDFSNDPRLGFVTNQLGEVSVSNYIPIYSLDGTHPTRLGHSVIKSYYDSLLNNIVEGNSPSISLSKRISDIELEMSTLRNKFILNTKDKKKADIAISGTIYIADIRGAAESGGVLRLMGYRQLNDSSKSTTIIEPSGFGRLSVGSDERPQSANWLFKDKAGFPDQFPTGGTVFELVREAGARSGFLALTFGRTERNYDGFIGLDINSEGNPTEFKMQTPNGVPIRLRAVGATVHVDGGQMNINCQAYAVGLKVYGELGFSLSNTGNQVTASAGTPSTHKVKIRIDDTDYYFLATNV